MSISRAGGSSQICLARSTRHVGLVAHRAHDHHHLVAVLLGADRPPGGRLNLFRIGDAGAAELLNDDSHGLLSYSLFSFV